MSRKRWSHRGGARGSRDGHGEGGAPPDPRTGSGCSARNGGRAGAARGARNAGNGGSRRPRGRRSGSSGAEKREVRALGRSGRERGARA